VGGARTRRAATTARRPRYIGCYASDGRHHVDVQAPTRRDR
jgi:hypothetical protein